MSHRQIFASGETIREQKDEITRLQAEIERLRLTDAEREAVEWFAEIRKPLTRLTQSHNREQYIATLRGLLERVR